MLYLTYMALVFTVLTRAMSNNIADQIDACKKQLKHITELDLTITKFDHSHIQQQCKRQLHLQDFNNNYASLVQQYEILQRDTSHYLKIGLFPPQEYVAKLKQLEYTIHAINSNRANKALEIINNEAEYVRRQRTLLHKYHLALQKNTEMHFNLALYFAHHASASHDDNHASLAAASTDTPLATMHVEQKSDDANKQDV